MLRDIQFFVYAGLVAAGLGLLAPSLLRGVIAGIFVITGIMGLDYLTK